MKQLQNHRFSACIEINFTYIYFLRKVRIQNSLFLQYSFIYSLPKVTIEKSLISDFGEYQRVVNTFNFEKYNLNSFSFVSESSQYSPK